MTDKQKLEKIKMLADEMYYRMQNLSTDTSGIRKAMYDYHQFIIYEYYKEEPVSNDLKVALEDYAYQVAYNLSHDWLKENATWDNVETAVKLGAQWQKERLLKDAQGDDLPEFDKEVIVLYRRYPLENSEYAVGFAHRPKEYWEGKNIETGKIIRYYPKRYDKGSWNIPDVKYWLDLDLPKTEE